MEPTGPRILVISSHAQALVQSVDALRAGLEGAEVHAASSLEHGSAAVTEREPDVVFLLAQSEALEECLEFCRWLRDDRAGAEASLVLVYPSREVSDWKRLYDAQGDMFIVWDGNFVDGLASCVKSLVGRRYRMVAAPLSAGSLQLFPEGLLARIGGRLVSFTPLEFRIVRYLVEHADRAVTRGELERVITEVGPRPSRARKPQSIVHQCIYTIRKKLAPDDAVISNIRGIGYRIDLSYKPAGT